MEWAYELRSSGRISEAVDIAEKLLRVGQIMAASADRQDDLWRSTKVQESAIFLWRPLIKVREKTPSLSSPNNLAFIANQAGRKNLANEVLKLSPKADFDLVWNVPWKKWTGVSEFDVAYCHWYNAALRWLRDSLPYLGLLWVCSLTLRRRFLWQTETHSRSSVVVTTVIGCLAMALLLGLSIQWEAERFTFLQQLTADFSFDCPAFSASLSTGLLLFSALYFANQKLEKTNHDTQT